MCKSGDTKPLASASLSDNEEMSRTIFLHQAIFQSMAELGQLRRGLNVLGVCEEMARGSDSTVRILHITFHNRFGYIAEDHCSVMLLQSMCRSFLIQ